ncbi:aldehyde dehydrogenase family protein [Methylobacter marinus]|uniref:aldehyde dehydrogenase family protein n=1 Tax=Methylobacter marinus TaxID=34058 RepID=UPI0003A69513|nr:aldehyde dehydrogenase family protein [Methylobacter marinus]
MGDTWQSAGACSGFEVLPIGGRWRAGRSSHNLINTNPFNGQTLVVMLLASAQDEAYESAGAAQKAGAAAAPVIRAEVLLKAMRIFDARREDIIPRLIDEAGSSRLKAIIEGQSARGVTLDAISFPYHASGRILRADIAGKDNRINCRSLGVIDIISLRHFPLHLIQRSLAPESRATPPWSSRRAIRRRAGDLLLGRSPGRPACGHS